MRTDEFIQVIADHEFDGLMRYGIREEGAVDVIEAATWFSLRPDHSIYREISRSAAKETLARILHLSLAYDHPHMAPERADEMSGVFLGYFRDEATTFYSNGSFGTDRRSWGGWGSATSSTFDTGVIAVAPARTGYIWAEDED